MPISNSARNARNARQRRRRGSSSSSSSSSSFNRPSTMPPEIISRARWPRPRPHHHSQTRCHYRPTCFRMRTNSRANIRRHRRLILVATLPQPRRPRMHRTTTTTRMCLISAICTHAPCRRRCLWLAISPLPRRRRRRRRRRLEMSRIRHYPRHACHCCRRLHRSRHRRRPRHSRLCRHLPIRHRQH